MESGTQPLPTRRLLAAALCGVGAIAGDVIVLAVAPEADWRALAAPWAGCVLLYGLLVRAEIRASRGRDGFSFEIDSDDDDQEGDRGEVGCG